MTETLLIKSDLARAAAWADAFAGVDNLQTMNWQDINWDADQEMLNKIDYALVWQPPAGTLLKLPNLKIIFSIGAGVDHLQGEGMLPAGVPVVKMVDAILTAGMSEYVIYNILRFHRHLHLYSDDQANKVWHERLQIPNAARRVGIMGCGILGEAAARAVAGLGFKVAVWSRTQKNIDAAQSYFGVAQLDDFLAVTNYLVCLLSLNADTENILNAKTFAQLPKGAFVINPARGRHLLSEDLIAALDNGHIAAAALDVFTNEPLPKDSPLWSHPKITITPHIASMTLPATAAKHVINNIKRHRRGRELTHSVAI